jgi:hypothetical protein
VAFPRRTRARWWAAAAWAGAAVALFAFFVRISLSGRVNSDGANSALQAWDLVHGHLLLHGWRIGDATFYFFELPPNGVLALLFGLGDLASHLASAMTYLIVAAVAVSLAVLGAAVRRERCAVVVVVAVLAAPLLSVPAVRVLLEEPDQYFGQVPRQQLVRPGLPDELAAPAAARSTLDSRPGAAAAPRPGGRAGPRADGRRPRPNDRRAPRPGPP